MKGDPSTELALLARQLEELNQIGAALAAERDITRLLDLILTKAREITSSGAGSLYLTETASGTPIDDPRQDDVEPTKVLRFAIAQNDSVAVPFRTATRYESTIKYLPTEITKIAVITEGSAGLTESGDDKSKNDKAKEEEEPKKKGFGLGNLKQAVAPEKQSAQVTASGGARGVGPDRLAKGGNNPNPVNVAVSADEVSTFKKGIA